MYYLKASNTQAGNVFGRSVSISDGTVVVGAPLRTFLSGAAYVFNSLDFIFNNGFE
ncbi:MAG: FG-GAP repeat protein [Alcanivoracaceae bacterium]|nr:FG-GAP repeat protein [Alcanivoracaceae bacterium]